jgi:hypothetical protein
MKPVVYLGPSLRVAEAIRLLAADFRPPVKRGDLASANSQVVVILDGEFNQNYAVTPKEILHLLGAGVTVLGAASMGALRAVELAGCGMTGIGWVYEAYRNGLIDGDDEVALTYCPLTFQPLTVPLVNVRYWLEQLVAAGLLGAAEAQRVVRRARQIYYADRTPERLADVLQRNLGANRLAGFRCAGFQSIPDVKRADAMAALAVAGRLISPVAEGQA